MNFQNLPKGLLLKFNEVNPMEWVNSLQKTEISDVFKNLPLKPFEKNKPTVIIVIGPSGAGKDTSIEGLISESIGVQAITATSRERRIDENEPEWKYTWMKEPQLSTETDVEYENRLAKKYDLIEHDFHHGSVYGLPRENLQKAAASGKPVLIRTENRGLDTLTEELTDEYNIISICITAPTYLELFDRIKDRNDTLIRMLKAPDEIKDAKNKVNFVLLNPDNPQDPEMAKKNTQNAMKALVKSLII